MNIQLPEKHRGLTNIVAKYYGQTVESFVIEAVVQAAKNARVNHKIASEIDSFIDNSKQSLWMNTKQAFSKQFKEFINPFFAFFLFLSLLFFVLFGWQINKLNQNYDEVNIFITVLFLILFGIFMLLAIINLALNVFFEYRKNKNNEKSMFLRIKKLYKIRETDVFADKLSKNYSIEELKLAERDLKEIIVNLENRQNQFSAAMILVSIILLWWIRYYSESLFNYLINTFPGLVGNTSFVFFVAALLIFISKIDYFNNLIFYKKALLALQKAQDKIDKKD